MSDPIEESRAGDRIAKLLARAGIASRREVERMIEDGRIAKDGVAIDTPATILTSLAGITVDGRAVKPPTAARLFLYHKPPGLLVTERDPMGRPTIYDRLPTDLPRLVPVGRLDLNTEGLLLLTTDGGLKRQLELPATGVERSYRARAYGDITQGRLEELIDGIKIEDVRYGSINANLERRTGANVWIEMTLTEGKNREVRNVLEYLGLQVSRLIRTRYGPFVLGDLPVGEVGEVQDGDVANFRKNPKALPQARITESRPERPDDFERRPRPERMAERAPAPASSRNTPSRAAVEPDGRLRRAAPVRPTATRPTATRPAQLAPPSRRETPSEPENTGRRTQRSGAFKAARGFDDAPRAEDTRAQDRKRPSASRPAPTRNDRGRVEHGRDALETRAPRGDAPARPPRGGGTLRPATTTRTNDRSGPGRPGNARPNGDRPGGGPRGPRTGGPAGGRGSPRGGPGGKR